MARASVGRPPRRLLNNNNNISVKTLSEQPPTELQVDSEVSDDRLNRELVSGFRLEAPTGDLALSEGLTLPTSQVSVSG
jgi:hypothetical protein